VSRRHIALGLAPFIAAGCASGPDYRPPEAPVDAAFVQPVAAGEPPSEFWRGFNDPLLDALIADALRANTDVRIAQARLAEARASASEVDTTRLPTIGATAGVARGTDPGDPQGRSASVSVSANWELDFFGRLRSGRESAAAMDLVRLAIPRRVYTQSHIDYVAEAVIGVAAMKNELRGYRITKAPAVLRHFTALFEPLPA